MYGYVPALIDAMHSPFEFESRVLQSPLRGEGAMAVDYKPVVTNCQFAQTTAVARPYSCFPAGTLVRTQTGLRAIERLKAGDMVLSQEARTGELAYKPVLQRTVRDSDAIVHIALNGEVLQATKGHPIRVNGREWQMAKQLRPGDLLHGIDGPIEVEAVHEAPQRAVVHNLVVAEFNTYFVGETGVLVHDNSLYIPPGVAVPGHRLDVEHEEEDPK